MTKVNKTDARQAKSGQKLSVVLGISLALAVLALAVIYMLFFA